MLVAILHYTAPPVAGGVESIVRQQALLLKRHGYGVRLIAGRGRSFDSAISVVRIPELAATHPRQQRISAELAKGAISEDLARERDRLRDKLEVTLQDADVLLVHNAVTLHFNMALTQAVLQLAEGPWDGRVVAWTHDVAAVNPLYESELHSGNPWDLYRLPQPGIRYVAISQTRRDELLRVWTEAQVTDPPEVIVIPNGIDPMETLAIPPAIRPTFEQANLFTRSHVLLAPVRITRRKNLELAIKVVADLQRRGHDAILLVTGPIWGHHPERSRLYLEELCALAAKVGVRERVIFFAQEFGRPLNAKEIAALYSVATNVLMPSASEGFGLPILEAGLHRVPVVASDLPVFRELSGDRACYFPLDASPGHVADLVESSTSPGSLRETVLRDYAWDAIFRHRFKPLLDSMVDSKESRS